jgi:hydrogenase maturation protease
LSVSWIREIAVSRGLVLGLGNPILTDDGVGIHVARAVADHTPSTGAVTVAEASVGGLRLLDVLAGYDWAVIVDAVLTGGRPGDVTQLQPGDLRASLHSGSTHDLSLPGALALGRQIGMALPADERIVLVAVEAEDVLTFGESCTPAVAAAVPRAARVVQDLIVMFLDKDCESEYN